MHTTKNEKRLKVAILGGGPAGLGLAIELARLTFIDWELYEKKPQISETGGGLSLQPQIWKLLEHNGAAAHLTANDYFRSAEGHLEQRRNGRSGELLTIKYNPKDVPLDRRSCRLARSKLQSALLKNVDQTHINLSKKLVRVEHLPDNRVRISFEDGFVDEVDLLVAADGLRSVIRNFSFPNNTPHYNGQTVYRTIVSKSEVRKIDGIPWAPIFWKHVSGLYVYTCPLGDDDFEVTLRIRRPQEGAEPPSWGRPFDLHTLLHKCEDFCPQIRQILNLAAKGETQEFALFSGPRLKRIVSHGNIAFIGDASHPLLGNFGSGASFALEDVYTLTKIIGWALPRGRPLSDALDMFDSIRSPHYERLYKVLDNFTSIKATLRAEGLPVDEEIAERVKRISQASVSWMYYYEIDKVVDGYLRGLEKCENEARPTSKVVKQVMMGLGVTVR
ncbi:FAD/NAD(P)-binding domain-containing protein [Annulohypoxylon maeteangense]|uniref:FAD/NAD(P)-binding domain-containing protein n=1 Tax=Annulohypoxylon maeteangense TaxID=1927788 RepID=UPI002008E831|nr:FAD/NAD(P)-binding domain-containing protein [Annulohypoxylon maeteangense]KAI0884182.1 FAD/NAD(P)-binding domain-containing protein [Annulohypoxylon maeteangense]